MTTKPFITNAGQQLFDVHHSYECYEEHCPIHRPSEHALADLPLLFDGTHMVRAVVDEELAARLAEEHSIAELPLLDEALAEEHGLVGARMAPDPDDRAYQSYGAVLLNSAACRKCGDVLVSASRHDYAECSCGALAVDGGRDYVRRTGEASDRIERSIVLRKAPVNPNAEWYSYFMENASEHVLEVHRRDGEYVHLEMRSPSRSRYWSWQLLSSPGVLTTVGDIADGYSFSRERDMLAFFRTAGRSRKHYSDGAPSIDFRYWAQKLLGPARDSINKYSEKAFLASVQDCIDQSEPVGLSARAFEARQLELLEEAYLAAGESAEAAKEALQAHLRGELSLGRLWSPGGERYEPTYEMVDGFHVDELIDADFPVTTVARRAAEYLEDAEAAAQDGKESAVAWLQEKAGDEVIPEDWYELGMEEMDVHFLYTCWAIAMAVSAYYEWLDREDRVLGPQDYAWEVRRGRLDERMPSGAFVMDGVVEPKAVASLHRDGQDLLARRVSGYQVVDEALLGRIAPEGA